MKHRPAIHGQRNRRKEGVSSSWLGTHRSCNSDNLDGDGGGRVGLCGRARMCACLCMRACVMCLPYTITGLEIRVDRWPESTKNPVGPPNRVRQWSGGLPKLCQRTLHLLAFFITFAVAGTATMFFVFNISNIVIYSFFVASGNSISNISSNVYAE